MKFRFVFVMVCLVIVCSFCSGAIAKGIAGKFKVTIGKDDPNEIKFLKYPGDVRKEAAVAQAIGDQYITASEPNCFVVDVFGEPVLKVIKPNEAVNDQKLKKDYLLRYAQHQVRQFAHPKGKERVEASNQIRRLWRITLPVLLDNLGNKNMKINEASMKNLIVMRNENVIRMIIRRVQQTDDKNVKYSGVYAMSMMKEKRILLVKNRPICDEKRSAELADKIIIPFFKKLEKETKDATMKKYLKVAYDNLSNPIDTRPKRVK